MGGRTLGSLVRSKVDTRPRPPAATGHHIIFQGQRYSCFFFRFLGTIVGVEVVVWSFCLATWKCGGLEAGG